MESKYNGALLYDSILSDIYRSQAVRDPAGNYLHSINRLLDADSTTLIIADRRTNKIIDACGAGVTQHSIESPATPYVQHLWTLEPIPQTREAANVFQARDFRRNRSYREFFQACLRPFNLAPFISVNIKIDQGRNLCLRLARLEGQQDFGPAELGVAKNLARHLSGAHRADAMSLHSPHELGRILADVANHLWIGVFVLNENGQLIFSNQRAQQHLEAVSLEQLDPLLQRAAGIADSRMIEDIPVHPVAALRVFSIASDRNSMVHFAASQASQNRGDTRRRYTVVFSCADNTGAIEPTILEQLFHLTPSESAVAARLARGMNIDEIATALCRSRNTIRAHARSIHRKLEVNNQAQLVGKILGSLAGVITAVQESVI